MSGDHALVYDVPQIRISHCDSHIYMILSGAFLKTVCATECGIGRRQQVESGEMIRCFEHGVHVNYAAMRVFAAAHPLACGDLPVWSPEGNWQRRRKQQRPVSRHCSGADGLLCTAAMDGAVRFFTLGDGPTGF